MTYPSTVWAQLSTPGSPNGSIPFVSTDGVTITTDVNYLWYNQSAHQLSVAATSDQTGTDSLNTYYNNDSYWPYSTLVTTPLGANGTTAGFTVSTSRGTGVSPLVSNSGDFVGKFSGWSYTGTPTVTYQEVAGINIYTNGTLGSTGMGGRMTLFAKQDGVTLPAEMMQLYIASSGTGIFSPLVDNTVLLGGGYPIVGPVGFNGLFLSWGNTTSIPGNCIINKPAGKVRFVAGASTLTVTNNLITANAIVQAQLETVDATALYVRSVLPFADGFTITLNAACTVGVVVSFISIRTDA